MILRNAIRNMASTREPSGGSDLLTLQDSSGWKSELSGTGETQAMKLSAVNRCVQVISDSMGKLPVRVLDRITKKPSNNHYLEYMLTVRTNEDMTPSDYKKLMETRVMLKGNAYALIWRDPRSGEPRELIPLEHCWTVRDQGQLWYLAKNPKTGEYRKLWPENVIHYRYYAEDGINGISVLSHAKNVINTASASQDYEQKYYAQRARPDGILTIDSSLTTEAKEEVRKQWETFHRGADNAFRVAVMDLGMKYQPIGVTPKDSQFIESKEISIKDIARFFGVPLYKLQEGKQSYNSNEQNSIEYIVDTLHPRVQRYNEEDTYKLLFEGDIRQDLRISRNMMAELKGDYKSRGEWYKVMHQVGAFSPNDILELEDMPATEGGDVHSASLNYVPLHRFEELSEKRAQSNRGGGRT